MVHGERGDGLENGAGSAAGGREFCRRAVVEGVVGGEQGFEAACGAGSSEAEGGGVAVGGVRVGRVVAAEGGDVMGGIGGGGTGASLEAMVVVEAAAVVVGAYIEERGGGGRGKE